MAFKPVQTTERFPSMFTKESLPDPKPPRISQKQMRELSFYWDKAFIHFEQGAFQRLQELTKEYLKPNQLYRSYVERWTQKQNETGDYNRAEEILAQLMAKHGSFNKVGFESQYRVIQEATIYEQVDKGVGERDATIKEEPILVVGKYRDRSGAEHNIMAALNPIVNEYDLSEQVAEYNHFAERAKMPLEQEKSYYCFAKGDNGQVLYRVSVGTLVTGEHIAKTVPRGQIASLVGKEAVEQVIAEAEKRHHSGDIPLR